MIAIVLKYSEAFASGLRVTLELAMVVWVVGLSFGFLFGALAAGRPSIMGRLVSLASFVLSGLPILVFLFWLHYPLQAMLGVVIDPFLTASFALSVVNAFATAELVRNALDEFPSHYLLAARVSGLNPRQTLLHIQMPILLRQIIPGLLTSQVAMLQATLFASLISVEELFRVAQRINAMIYAPVEIYSALGLFFLIICLPVNGLALWLKSRYTRNYSET